MFRLTADRLIDGIYDVPREPGEVVVAGERIVAVRGALAGAEPRDQ